MPSNLGFEMTYKGNGVNVPLHPTTNIDQVLGWNIGEVYGPYVLTLSASTWSNNQQTVAVDGVTVDDRVKCVKVLTGTETQMKAQDVAYNLLDPQVGIESLNNQIRFTCTDNVPNIDIQVQVAWTR